MRTPRARARASLLRAATWRDPGHGRGFSVLSYMTMQAYRNAPPIPRRVVDEAGNVMMTYEDIELGQWIVGAGAGLRTQMAFRPGDSKTPKMLILKT